MNENLPLSNVSREMPEEQSDFEALYHGLEPKKKLFADMMIKSFGNVSQSCKACGILSRRTYYNWLAEDQDFFLFIKGCEFEEMRLDFAEANLNANMADKKEASIIFFLKTKGQKRGYIERPHVKAPVAEDTMPSWFDGDAIPDYIEDAVIISETNKMQDDGDLSRLSG